MNLRVENVAEEAQIFAHLSEGKVLQIKCSKSISILALFYVLCLDYDFDNLKFD